jgi:phospholipase C
MKGMGALAGAAAMPKILSCGGAERPKGITHIVVVMMENRSYDHYLGARSLIEGKPGNGLSASMSNPTITESSVSVFRDPAFCIPDPPHGWDASHAQWNQGAMDGFMREYNQVHGPSIPPHVMGYYSREDLPFTWALADEYASCDAWFCSVMGPTWPNRLFLLSGQSGGFKGNQVTGGGFGWKSIFHVLEEHSVPWVYLYQDLPFAPLFKDINVDRVRSFTLEFFDHAKNGTLPPVTFIEPNFSLNDDHPPHHPLLGQQFLASVYSALANSPLWENVLFVVTYDEHGGYFDHVSPPKTVDDRAADGFDQLGFRVPAIVAGPYVKQGYVSSLVRDHTSVLAHIRNMFNLPTLTMREAAAMDLSDLIDNERLAAGNPRKPAVLPAIEVDESTLPALCFGGEEDVDLHRAADAGVLDKRWDRRGFVRDDARAIGEALDKHGGGRFLNK